LYFFEPSQSFRKKLTQNLATFFKKFISGGGGGF